jgi:type I restriction enzyme S subunit
MSAGSRMPRTAPSDLASLPVLVPPLALQRRIVDLIAHLDDHLATIRVEIDSVSKVLQSARRDCWARHEQECASLASVLYGITAGRSPDTSGERPQEGQPAVLKVNAVDPSGDFLAEETKALPPDHSMRPEWELQGGEVLVTRANTAERVAAVARVPDGIRNGLYLCDKTLRLDLVESKVDAGYIAEILLAPQARLQVAAMATGVGSSMVNISQAKLSGWTVPIPPVEVQSREAALLQSLRANVTSLRDEEKALRALRRRLQDGLLASEVTIPSEYDALLAEAV